MAAKYSDKEIAALLQERKPLPQDYQARIQLRSKCGHKERDLDVVGENGNQFRLILRQSDSSPLDFSIILGVFPPNSQELFRLRRYNGRSHEHTNRIEGKTFWNFHIHAATERYQELGMREDSYAEPTECFSDFRSALCSMLKDCGFEVPTEGQRTFLEGE